MNITLTTMRYFIEAARYENFSKAAIQLYTAQPNLSKKIAELERTIGVRLFQRTGKQVRLTAAGQYLYQEWSAALDQVDRSMRRARAMEQEQQDTLTLGILEGLTVGQDASEQLESLRERYPRVQLRLERCGIHRLWQRFEDRSLDMIVTSELGGTAPAVQSSIVRRVVSACRGVIAINVRNPMAEHSTVTLSMLRDESFIAISQEASPQGYRTIREACRRVGFEPRIARDASSIETLLLYVEAGIGISILSENSRLVSNPNVRLIPLEDLRFENAVYWHTDSMSMAVKAAVESFLEQEQFSAL